MTAATILKRINAQRKEIRRYEKEIAYYKKEYLGENEPENVKEDGRKWIAYYTKHIKRVEEKIAEMSKEAAKLATEEEQKAMIKAMAEDMAKRGFADEGYTTNGLKYLIIHNQYGFTERTDHCFSMRIEGKGVVFASGTLETVAQYILKN
jgi:hypothetical protein